MLELARTSKRMPITRNDGFVIFPTGSANPLIAVAIAARNGAAYMHSSKRRPACIAVAGLILQPEIIPRLRNRRLYNG